MNSTPTQSETLATDSLATVAHGSNPRKADVRGILKRKNKNGGYSYRAQVRLNDGMPPQSKTFPTLPEARAWKTQEEAKRRQGMYLPSMTSKHKTLGKITFLTFMSEPHEAIGHRFKAYAKYQVKSISKKCNS